MGSASRRKGRDGEAEVAAIWEANGFDVRGLEGEGDHLCIRRPTLVTMNEKVYAGGLTLHSEVKRAETTKIWQWLAQLEAEAPPGTLPVLSFRRNRSPWYAVTRLEQFAELLS